VSGGELVIVTAWKRPDFLSAALQRLLVADDGRQRYRICLDRGFSREVGTVAEQFARQLGARALIRRRSHRYRGNSYNVLMSYREAVAAAPDLIHLVEDDVFVSADYFEFHRRAHQLLPDAFAVSSCRNQQFPPEMNPPDEEDTVYAHVSYQSLGVSFRVEPLAKVVRHAQHGYFAGPVAYCRRHWPNSAINPNHAEQDGLIHRMIEASGRPTVYPFSPRAYHAGFVGYHRKGALLAGTVAQRAATLLRMTTAELNAAAHSYPDHVAVDLDANRKPVDRVAAWP
jgi:hypothetical protein